MFHLHALKVTNKVVGKPKNRHNGKKSDSRIKSFNLLCFFCSKLANNILLCEWSSRMVNEKAKSTMTTWQDEGCWRCCCAQLSWLSLAILTWNVRRRTNSIVSTGLDWTARPSLAAEREIIRDVYAACVRRMIMIISVGLEAPITRSRGGGQCWSVLVSGHQSDVNPRCYVLCILQCGKSTSSLARLSGLRLMHECGLR